MEIRINLFKKKLRFINSINLLNLNTRENKLFILFFWEIEGYKDITFGRLNEEEKLRRGAW